MTETDKNKRALGKENQEKKSFGENFRDGNFPLKYVCAVGVLENLENVCIFFPALYP